MAQSYGQLLHYYTRKTVRKRHYRLYRKFNRSIYVLCLLTLFISYVFFSKVRNKKVSITEPTGQMMGIPALYLEIPRHKYRSEDVCMDSDTNCFSGCTINEKVKKISVFVHVGQI
jgi:hypothetical protein